MDTYKILRFFGDGRPRKVIQRGVSLECAQAHCNNPANRGTLRSGIRWFDGFTRQ